MTDRKLKISAFFIFRIKRAKIDKIFNFLKDCFSVMSGPMDMIFETNVTLLKNIISQFFSKYSKSYKISNVKS